MNDLELLTLLLLSPQFWDYMPEVAHPVSMALGIESRALCVLGEHFTNCAIFPALLNAFDVQFGRHGACRKLESTRLA